MARQKVDKKLEKDNFQSFFKHKSKYLSRKYMKEILVNPNYTMAVGWLLLIVELLLNIVIVEYVPYTEIDWRAYMQECEGFLNGTLDYTQLKGDTGPLVYPAGFLYIYSMLYYLTARGENIRLAQYVFIVLYLLQLFLTLKIYEKTKKLPPYAIVLTTLTSYRIHSIYSLRLFNDCWAVLLFFIALNLFLRDFWKSGSVFYSLAVGIKMNILLYAPCLLLAYLSCCGLKHTVINIFICALVQLFLGLPFLLNNFVGYVERSFNIGRIFDHKWTVNFRFLPVEIFENRGFHLSLLCLHLLTLAIFAPYLWKYLTSYAKLKQLEQQLIPQLDNEKQKKIAAKKKNKQKFNVQEQQFLESFELGLKQQSERKQFTVDFSSAAQLFVLPFFVTNLIGISFSRSLHYQFYSWYYFGLVYLGWNLKFPVIVLLVLGLLETSWNTYPSTQLSSVVLHCCHALLLIVNYLHMKTSSNSKKIN